MTYLFEKVENYKKYYNGEYGQNPIMFLENWTRFTINPISGADEEFHLRFSEVEVEKNTINVAEAANLLGVSVGKLREWARGFIYNKVPIKRDGNKLKFVKEDLIEWSKTPEFKKLRDTHIFYRDRQAEAQKEAKVRRDAEKLAKEEAKKKRLEKKMLLDKNNRI